LPPLAHTGSESSFCRENQRTILCCLRRAAWRVLPEIMSKKLHIVIIEDCAGDVELVEHELRRAGLSASLHRAQTAAELSEALRQSPADLVLSDCSMPEFTGLEALALTRKEAPTVPFIALSGSTNKEMFVEILKHGATDCISKDDLSQLGPAIRRALAEVQQHKEKHRAEVSLRDSESRFRAIFEGAGTGIAVEDLQGRIVETNRALQQMLGYTADELQTLTRRDFTHGHDHKDQQELYNRLLSGESDYYQVEKRFVRKDGRIIWGRLTVSMVRDASENPQFPLAMIEDITERQRAEEVHLQYAAIVESSNDAIVSGTFDEVIFSWNPAAERLYGYTAREANGRSMSIIIPPDKEDEFAQIVERIKRGERMDNFETTRVRKDGSIIHVSVTTSLIKDAAGKITGVSSISRDITSRKRAEEALRKSESSLARAQRIAHLGNWEWDLKTGTMTWSEELYRMFGLNAGEFAGTHDAFLEHLLPEDRQLLLKAEQHTLASREPFSVDHRILTPSGQIKTVSQQAELLLDEKGKPSRMLGTVLDVTQRKRAENRSAAFSKLGQRLSSATTPVEAARVIVELADDLLGWDSCSLDLCSADLKTCKSVLCVDIVDGQRRDVDYIYNNTPPSPRIRKIMEEGAALILRDKRAKAGEFIPFGDKGRLSASLMYVPVHNGPNVIGVLSIQSYTPDAYSQDDLHTLQALADHCGGALERIRAGSENQKLAAFPQFNPNPVLELGSDGAVNYYNEAARQMARSLRKKHPSEFLPAETSQWVKECLATGESKLRHQTIIENRTISWSFFPVPAVGIVHCYAADITDRQNLEAQLRQAQKMESVGQLAGGIAHDFNNILTVIQGHTSLLGMTGNLSEDASESTQQIGLAAERAANLTRQLLTFSRRQIIQPKNLDLNEVVNNMTKMLRRLLGEDVILQVNYTAAVPLIHADPGMMEQILMNLSVNARDAMPKGGRLFVDTSLVTIDKTYAENIPEAVPGEYICLAVKDTGKGIPPEILPRIFEPFFTTKDVGKGTGLGLATVYGIVQQHRGWIKVASTVGEGTVFQIFLPTVPGKLSVQDAQAEPKVRGGKETILVVEDEAPLRVLVRSVLERYGYKVLEAVSGVAALSVWEQNKDKVELLLTDMVMPHGLSGRELATKLVAEKPGLKVIYSSGYSLAVVGSDMVLQEGLNFLQKPYHPRKLAQAVRDCLDG
jgi:two-component system cell cycle sensor histidine kinase/response regulator CckA